MKNQAPIVDRLNFHAFNACQDLIVVLIKAAQEIERLNSLVETLQADRQANLTTEDQ